MRRLPFVAAAFVAGMVTLASGCGNQNTGAGGGASSSASPAPSPSAARCPAGSRVIAGSSLTVRNADNGAVFCVSRGTGVLVYLKGTPARMWTRIHAAGGALQPKANGHLMLARGVTGASFVAARPGVAVISSARPVCPSPSPGTVGCDSTMAFRVTLAVQP
jgi:hypothetical protein